MNNKKSLIVFGLVFLWCGFLLLLKQNQLSSKEQTPYARQEVAYNEYLGFSNTLKNVWGENRAKIKILLGTPAVVEVANTWTYQKNNSQLQILFSDETVNEVSIVYNQPLSGNSIQRNLTLLGFPDSKLVNQNEERGIWQDGEWQITAEQVNFGGWPSSLPEVKVLSFSKIQKK